MQKPHGGDPRLATRDHVNPGKFYALAAAVLFGASTPAAKWLLRDASPWLLAGILYLGSGLGLLVLRVALRLLGRSRGEAKVHGRQWAWLAGATLFGGILGPSLLMAGLARSDASAASLLLNVEGVATALLAWFAFGENFDRRILAGMISIVLGAVLVSSIGVPTGGAGSSFGPLFIVCACVAWGIDNNLTKKVSGSDPTQIAMVKGLAAGLTNTVLAIVVGSTMPAAQIILGAGVVGFLGYGVSILCFVLALRHIGAARTGAYFSLAPFVGAVLAVAFMGEPPTWQLGAAGLLMGFGIWLHLTERHDHEHRHEAVEHEHAHMHDEHHQHAHDAGHASGEPHSHRHRHELLVHKHTHFPDLHHNHSHSK